MSTDQQLASPPAARQGLDPGEAAAAEVARRRQRESKARGKAALRPRPAGKGSGDTAERAAFRQAWAKTAEGLSEAEQREAVQRAIEVYSLLPPASSYAQHRLKVLRQALELLDKGRCALGARWGGRELARPLEGRDSCGGCKPSKPGSEGRGGCGQRACVGHRGAERALGKPPDGIGLEGLRWCCAACPRAQREQDGGGGGRAAAAASTAPALAAASSFSDAGGVLCVQLRRSPRGQMRRHATAAEQPSFIEGTVGTLLKRKAARVSI